jgi:hypothetical protein
VRRDEEALAVNGIPQGRLGREGLDLEDIECGAAQLSRAKRRVERQLVHGDPTAEGDKDGTGQHRVELSGTDKVKCLRRARQSTDDYMALLKQGLLMRGKHRAVIWAQNEVKATGRVGFACIAP